MRFSGSKGDGETVRAGNNRNTAPLENVKFSAPIKSHSKRGDNHPTLSEGLRLPSFKRLREIKQDESSYEVVASHN